MANFRILRMIREKLKIQGRVDECGCEVLQWLRKGAGGSAQAEGWASRGHSHPCNRRGQGMHMRMQRGFHRLSLLRSEAKAKFAGFQDCLQSRPPPTVFHYISSDFINVAFKATQRPIFRRQWCILPLPFKNSLPFP